MATPAERLTEVRAMLTAANASILKLLGKTNQSVSFGDQSYTLADLEKLKKVRDQLRQEEASLASEVEEGGKRRRTIKIHFPSC